MSVGCDCCCVVCGRGPAAAAPEELVRETFRPTLTLQKTLQTLSLSEGFNFNVKNVFDLITRENGSFFCLTCLAALHKGMSVVAEIIKLEGRLKILGGMIGRKLSTNCVVDDYQQPSFLKEEPHLSELSSRHENQSHSHFNETKPPFNSSDADSEVNEPKEKNNTEKQVKVVKDQKLRRSNRRKCTTTSFPSSIKTLPPSGNQRKLPSGVQNCPSCDFSVDVRTPAQAKSPESLSLSVRNELRHRSSYKLAVHYRCHMSKEAKRPKINCTNNKTKVQEFSCPDCLHRSRQLVKVAQHYFSVHVFQKKLTKTGPSRLSCPVEKCSYVIEASLTPEGLRTKSNSSVYMRETFALHVLKEHDIPSSSAFKKGNQSKMKWSLVRRTKDKGKEYRCTRCHYNDRLPPNASIADYKSRRYAFLRHFYESHLKAPTS